MPPAPDLQLEQMEPAEVFTAIAAMSDDEFAVLMDNPSKRPLVIRALVDHMASLFRPDKAGDTEATIHIKLWDKPDGGYDHVELRIEGGACEIHETPEREADLTLKVRPTDLRKLVTGETGARRLAFKGRLRVLGDIGLAMKLPDLFDFNPTLTVPDTREIWRTERLNAAAYDAAVERPRVARVFGALMWGTDTRRLYEAIHSLAELPDGASVLDVPCGGGLAFRGLRADHKLTYIAADISPYMLKRAKARAAADGVANIAFTEADALNLHFDDATFDYVVTFNGLHCLPEQAPALAEMARVLRPGGRLIGTAVTRGEGRRQDLIIGTFRRTGWFGETARAADLRDSIEAAGFEDLEFELSGALSHFRARKPSA